METESISLLGRFFNKHFAVFEYKYWMKSDKNTWKTFILLLMLAVDAVDEIFDLDVIDELLWEIAPSCWNPE